MDGALLFSVFIFLAAACVLVPVSKLSGLGSVIGYLIAGVLIGPHILGLIDDPETILHFSEFGVVMMLFVIGLELQPKHLWDMRGRLLGLGGLQVSISVAALAGMAFLAGFIWAESLVIGMALALSSTAIALQIMGERKMMDSDAGQAGFSILLFQDVIVIAMIASLPFIAIMSGLEPVSSYGDGHGSDPHGPEGVWLALSILGVFAGMIIGGRVLLRPIFRLIARADVRETFTAIALLLVIGSALLMNWLGLSAALGAFIAGVVLADSEYRHQLERDIEPFKALLLGLFFISVGMSLNFETLLASPGFIVGAVIGLMLLKFAVIFIVASIFKLPLGDKLLSAVLLCQAGEFGFVLSSFALTEGAMQAETAAQLNAVIALSMALTPLIVLGYDKLIAPRLRGSKRTGDAPINQKHNVLILGFGRVGQIIGRLLETQDIQATIIDSDGDHIEFLKQFGHRVFYGDATDIDLLKIAGAHEADVIVIAMDDRDAVTTCAAAVKQAFPKARLVVRARGRPHLFDLLALDVDFAERETIRGALAMGRKSLEILGTPAQTAQQLSDDFLALDYQLVQDTFHLRDDISALAERADQGRAYLKETLNGQKAAQEHDAQTARRDIPDIDSPPD